MNESPEQTTGFEATPLTRAEYIGAITHFYRGEMHRATVSRMRLDTTSNWSIISVMGLVSFSMGGDERSHLAIIVGMVLVFTFLVIEARRFRFYDVWRSRVRMLETNFIAPILQRNLVSSSPDWNQMVADDLKNPRYKLSWHQAVKIRLLRNYLPMFALLLACWLIKINTLGAFSIELAMTEHGLQSKAFVQVLWWSLVSLVAGLYIYLIGVICLVSRCPESEDELWDQEFSALRNFDK